MDRSTVAWARVNHVVLTRQPRGMDTLTWRRRGANAAEPLTATAGTTGRPRLTEGRSNGKGLPSGAAMQRAQDGQPAGSGSDAWGQEATGGSGKKRRERRGRAHQAAPTRGDGWKGSAAEPRGSLVTTLFVVRTTAAVQRAWSGGRGPPEPGEGDRGIRG